MKSRPTKLGSFLTGASLVFLLSACAQPAKVQSATESNIPNVTHVKVFYEQGKFGGWPANWGMWNWGNEILVGYTMANHKDTTGHNYDVNTAITKFSRSKDGGKTWTMEDPFEKGITESTWENHLKEKGIVARDLKEPINFQATDFAFNFRMRNAIDGGTSFYYTYNRGQKWEGPFDLKVDFPGDKPAGIVSRTDYVVEGKHEMTAFLTVGFWKEKQSWRQVACVRTTDGGQTWKFLSWIGEPGINSIMPSSLRLGPTRLLSMIRRTKPPRMVAFVSDDNGSTWTQQPDPVKVDANGHPPALLKLKDGRLCMIFGIRHEKTVPDGIGMYAVFSNDDGKTWGNPYLIQGKDGGNWDIGYPRALQLPNGNVIATYYYNHTGQGDKYRYIAASIFDPAKFK